MLNDEVVVWRGVKPLNIDAALTITQFAAIACEVDRLNIKLFIELGIYRGGFGSLMVARCSYVGDFYYIGVEKEKDVIDTRFLLIAGATSNVEIIIGDVFDYVVIDRIAQRINVTTGRAMVFSDATKRGEIPFYLPIMRVGDVLLVHDWPTEFDDNDIRSCLENRMALVHPNYWMGRAGGYGQDNGLDMVLLEKIQ